MKIKKYVGAVMAVTVLLTMPVTAAFETIYFARDSDVLSPAAIASLEKAGNMMRQSSALRVMVEGHANEGGPSTIDYDITVGDNRAKAVRNFLITYGIDATRIEQTSFGRERPVNPNCNRDDEACLSRNRRVEWRILAGDISSASVSVGTVIYTGSAVTPDVTVTVYGVTLRRNTDYTVSWSGDRINTSSTDAMITITGAGVYTGTVLQPFTITPKPLTTAMLSIPAVVFDNTEQTPVLTIVDGVRTLVMDTDYNVALKSQINAGSYAVTVTGIGNYTNTPSVDFVINPLPLTEAEVVVGGTYTFNGEELVPEADDVVVTLEGYVPTYSFIASENINAGTATVTVTGTGNFGGTATGTFTIQPKLLTDAMLSIPAVVFNGNSQAPILTAVDGTMALADDTDYTVTLEPQTDAGTYLVTVTGIGNYTGTASVDFVINPKTLTAGMLSVPAVVFNGNPQTPVLTIVDGTKTLVRDTDFTVILTPRTNAGTYPVTVTGMGNYTGTPSVDFVITDSKVSVLSQNRVIPGFKPNEETAVNTSANMLTGEFTAGPNPVNRQSGNVTFFRQGNPVQSTMFTIFDASGNVVNRVKIKDNKDWMDGNSRRIVGSWNLTDTKGRTVAEGTYLVKGVVTAPDGKKEKVSLMLGVK